MSASSAQPNPLLSFGGHSSAGVKPTNEDAFAVSRPRHGDGYFKGQVALVADGVSGASHGADASQLTVCDFISNFYDTPRSWSTSRSAARSLDSLNRWLTSQGPAQQWLTTFSGLIIKSHRAYLLQVGDSRIARYRNGRLEILSHSHQRKLGQRSVLTRALGATPHLEVDMHQCELQSDDLFVLTSDGVHDFINHKGLEQLLASATTDLEQLSESIVQQALLQGSDDNLTCLLIRVDKLPKIDQHTLAKALLQRRIPPVLSPSQQLDQFEVLEVLHASPRSHLYRVKDRHSGKLWALKAPSLNFEEDLVYLQAFVREAWVGSQFTHPNLMRIQSSPVESQFLYLLCDPIEGQSLRQWMQDHPTPSLAQCRPLLTQLVAALRAMQRLDMVHRDLKPENIMIDHHGQLKLIDFGATRVASLEEREDQINEDYPLGSAHYTAPETQFSLQADHRSDQFSLAVIAYEMLTGQYPHPGRPSQRRSQSWPYLSLLQHRPDLPRWIDDTLSRALAMAPANRYPAFGEFLEALNTPEHTKNHGKLQLPMSKRNPLKFWQILVLLLALLNIWQWL